MQDLWPEKSSFCRLKFHRGLRALSLKARTQSHWSKLSSLNLKTDTMELCPYQTLIETKTTSLINSHREVECSHPNSQGCKLRYTRPNISHHSKINKLLTRSIWTRNLIETWYSHTRRMRRSWSQKQTLKNSLSNKTTAQCLWRRPQVLLESNQSSLTWTTWR